MQTKIYIPIALAASLLTGCFDRDANHTKVLAPGAPELAGALLSWPCFEYMDANKIPYQKHRRRDNLYWVKLPNEQVVVDIWARDESYRYLFVLRENPKTKKPEVIQFEDKSPNSRAVMSPAAEDHE